MTDNSYSSHGHGGDVVRLSRESGKESSKIIDFSANLNPLGPPGWLGDVIVQTIADLSHYPDPGCTAFIQALSDRFEVPPETLTAGNGTSELLFFLPRALEKSRALIPSPAYIDYRHIAAINGLQVQELQLSEQQDFAIDIDSLHKTITSHDLVFIGHPANPAGTLCDPDRLRWLVHQHPSAVFIIDEAFIDFVQYGDIKSLRIDRPENVVVLYSLTKIFCIPGLRLGACFASIELSRRLREHLPTWNVNAFALAVGQRALLDLDYIKQSVQFVTHQRKGMEAEINRIVGLKCYPGQANFLLVKSEIKDRNAAQIAKALLAEGLAIRVCDNYTGLDNRYFRLAVRPEKQTERLIAALRKQLGIETSKPTTVRRAHRAPAIMVQGTGSNAGKSLLCAGLLRILTQEGYRAAPFKAQNMSLNSHVTLQGGEMGRAQALQAAACGLEPDVKMNPVLLKPSSEKGSQVILLGKALGHMNYGAYSSLKDDMLDKIHGAYDELAAQYDVMVIEGAGSPAEINLKPRDIVNMHMAQYADAKVLLVGDIERGGVFASFVGTLALLPEKERDLITGFVINRFRGDATLLCSALDYIKFRTGRPVLGVLPYITDLGLPEEDSVSFKNQPSHGPTGDRNKLDIAIIDLPHISNFTDFDPFTIEPDVSLRLVRHPHELPSAELIILPGSKNVLSDLKHLQKTGLAQRIGELAGNGTTFCIGICGGFQMLGHTIADPLGVETVGSEKTLALGLLPIVTTLMQDKTLARTSATHLPSGLQVMGYEIHHGRSNHSSDKGIIQKPDGEVIGLGSDDGRIWGTYLHGVFDDDRFRRWCIDKVRRVHNKKPAGRVLSRFEINTALDRLADTIRIHTDLPQILKLVGL